MQVGREDNLLILHKSSRQLKRLCPIHHETNKLPSRRTQNHLLNVLYLAKREALSVSRWAPFSPRGIVLPVTSQGDHLIDDNEWSFLISGKTLTPVLAGGNPAPDWIDARMWSEVQALAGLPAFEGLAESFAGPLLADFKVCLSRRAS